MFGNGRFERDYERRAWAIERDEEIGALERRLCGAAPFVKATTTAVSDPPRCGDGRARMRRSPSQSASPSSRRRAGSIHLDKRRL